MNKALVESLVQLTALREITQLRCFLVDEIKKLPAVSTVSFVQQRRSRALSRPQDDDKYEYLYYRVNDDGSIDEKPRDEFHQLLDPLDGPSLSDQKGSTSIYPIKIDNNTTEFVLFEIKKLSKELRFFFDSLFHVYKNHSELLLAAEIDELTGLQNRKAFDRVCNRLFRPKVATDAIDASIGQTCFAMIDMDHFKQVNDEFGHLYGDEVLLLFAQLMVREFRMSDHLFRYGGEEFAVILTNTNLETAYKALERFRIAAESFDYPQVGRKTVSIGYTLTLIDDNAPLTIDQADQALYYSKAHGRNQTNYFQHLIDSGKIQTKESEPVLFF